MVVPPSPSPYFHDTSKISTIVHMYYNTWPYIQYTALWSITSTQGFVIDTVSLETWRCNFNVGADLTYSTGSEAGLDAGYIELTAVVWLWKFHELFSVNLI